MGFYTSNLLTALGELHPAERITVVLDAGRGLPRFLESSPFEVLRISGAGGQVAWEQYHLPRAARGFDLLHSPANGAPLFCRVPRVVTVHDAIFVRRLADISERTYTRQVMGHYYRRLLHPPAIRAARAVITVSETSRKDISIKLKVPFERITVIPEALPEEFAGAEPEPCEEMLAALKIQRPYYLALGAYEKRKNISMLFEVLSLLKGRVEADFPLVVAGAENLDASGYSEGVRRLSITDRVIFLPYVGESRLKALYSNAKAFLFPSRKEGFGLPLLQAMHCSVPVVASETESNRETADDAALYFGPDDPKAWAEGLCRLSSDPSLASSLVEKGRARLSAFSWRNAALSTLEVYQRLFEKS